MSINQDKSGGEEETRSERRYPWFVLSVTSLGGFLVVLNMGTLNVALPEVSKHFHADAFTSSWILLSYMLVNTILILIFGQISDMFGRKRLYLLGMSIFICASLAIGFSPNSGVLILFRVIQAIGGALVITNNAPLIADAFPKHLLATGLGVNVLNISMASLIGPLMGGIVAVTLGWQWVFWFNVPIGAIALTWGLIILRPSQRSRKNEHVDVWGGIFVFIALGSLVIALSESSDLGWGNWMVSGGLVLFLIMTPLFIWRESRASAPLLDLKLFHSRAFTMANAATFLNSFSRASIVLLFALYFQFASGHNAFEAGLRVLPVTIGMLAISPFSGVLTHRYSIRLISSSGLAISMVGLLLLYLSISEQSSYLLISGGMFLLGLGSGLFLTPNTTAILTLVPASRRGVANGLRSMLNNMGTVISTAVSLMIVGMALPPRLKSVIYSGAGSVLSDSDMSLILRGYRWAIIALLVATVLGLAASLARPSLSSERDKEGEVEQGGSLKVSQKV